MRDENKRRKNKAELQQDRWAKRRRKVGECRLLLFYCWREFLQQNSKKLKKSETVAGAVAVAYVRRSRHIDKTYAADGDLCIEYISGLLSTIMEGLFFNVNSGYVPIVLLIGDLLELC